MATGKGQLIGSEKAKGAYELLKLAIDSGEYAPGLRLKESDIAKQYGISRTPIREALRRLDREGVISITPNRGAVVRALTIDELEDAYALRAAIEAFAASRAAVTMDAVAIAELSEINAEFDDRVNQEDPDVDTLIRLNRVFHATISKGSGNSRMDRALERTVVVPVALRRSFWQLREIRESIGMYHRELVKALASRDAIRAEAVMRSHIYAVRDAFVKEYKAAIEVGDAVA